MTSTTPASRPLRLLALGLGGLALAVAVTGCELSSKDTRGNTPEPRVTGETPLTYRTPEAVTTNAPPSAGVSVGVPLPSASVSPTEQAGSPSVSPTG